MIYDIYTRDIMYNMFVTPCSFGDSRRLMPTDILTFENRKNNPNNNNNNKKNIP
jgi:hypothetical protein